jgi:Ca2+-binding EF-hand superfamily protein
MKQRKTLKGTVAAGILVMGMFAGLPVLAQDAPPPGGPGGASDAAEGFGGRGQGFDFVMFDLNKDGKVTKAELVEARKASVAGADANADGKLSADEIAAIEIARATSRANDRAARMIAEFDVDGDGLLSVSELIVRPVPNRLFDRLNADGDDAVSQAEADAFREQMREGRGRGRGDGERNNRRDGDGEGRRGGWFGQDDQGNN